VRLAAWSEAQNIRLQALSHTVTGSITYGHRRDHIRLQARSHTVTGAIAYGHRRDCIRLQVRLAVWSEAENIDQLGWAMQSLKDSMRWDEQACTRTRTRTRTRTPALALALTLTLSLTWDE
jgi:hypothetical protein